MKKKKIISLVCIVIGIVIFIILLHFYNFYNSGELIFAIIENDAAKIEKYMNIPFNINTKYRVGESIPTTPLETACRYGNFELAKKMVLSKGADVNYSPDKDMGLAVDSIFLDFGKNKPELSEYMDIIEFFIKNKVDMNSSIILSTLSFNLKEYIFDFGEENTIELMDYLLDNGATYGHAQLITEASKINNLIILKYLIEDRKIEINYEKYYDRYALFEAVDNSSYECAKYLVSIGFRQDLLCDYPNYYGKTALQIAEAKGDERMIKILKKQ